MKDSTFSHITLNSKQKQNKNITEAKVDIYQNCKFHTRVSIIFPFGGHSVMKPTNREERGANFANGCGWFFRRKM